MSGSHTPSRPLLGQGANLAIIMSPGQGHHGLLLNLLSSQGDSTVDSDEES